MTIGLVEALVICVMVAFVVALAFRSGYTRGRGARPRQESEQTSHADHADHADPRR